MAHAIRRHCLTARTDAEFSGRRPIVGQAEDGHGEDGRTVQLVANQPGCAQAYEAAGCRQDDSGLIDRGAKAGHTEHEAEGQGDEEYVPFFVKRPVMTRTEELLALFNPANAAGKVSADV